ncbi:MAG TPA: hypothetical protein VMT16_15485 [Thermoanaerobaculia bacterium]|nr:hypothetical protein [Thermoanaerobaculia bacterium]
MAAVIQGAGIMVPYLMDERQEVARAFGLRRVPDFFLFNRDQRLAYHGRFDATDRPPGLAPDGAELRGALDSLLAGGGAPVGFPSNGEPIEWVAELGVAPGRGR